MKNNTLANKTIAMLLASFMAIISISSAYGQLSNNATPPSFSYGFNHSGIDPEFIYPDKSIGTKETNQFPLEAGFSVEVDLKSSQYGTMVKWPNGNTSWIIRLTSPGAPAVGIILENLNIPNQSEFFVYTPETDRVVKLSGKDVVSGTLTSPIFPGETLIIEYTENSKNPISLNHSLTGSFSISEVVVIYNGHEALFGSKDLGDSDPCQVNVNCSPEGDSWTKQKRGVARILLRVGASWFWCSGTLINTTAQDGTPYFLTADHCGGSASASDRNVWQFYFNYQRPGCPNTGTPPTNLITGCTLKARGPLAGGSDFQLVQLSSTPSNAWNPYYNGWDKSTTAATSGVGIHHPSGDAKKISTYVSTLSSATPNIDGSVMASNSAWRVTWSPTTNGHGVTEGGSSGSPIFNASGLVVGTLSGGSSTCTNPTYPDFYGKLSYHWISNGTAAASQLQPWLDPQGTNPTVLTGWEPSAQPYADFIANPTSAYAGNPITFTDLSGGGTISSWSWNFGEDASPATATTQGPHEVTYSTPGKKTVTLTVNGSYTTTKNDYITILDSPFIPPSNVTGEAAGVNSIKITWDSPQLVYEEGFENYPDFALTFEPWVQHDGDGSTTYGIQNTSFENSGYTGSFIIFNPSKTSPVLGTNWAPKTGDKYAACFSATSPPNNDWLITPLVKIETGFSFKFWAKSVTSQWGLERFKVGVSSGGITPASFTVISEDNYLQAPITWTEYTFDLSDYEGQWIRLAINCVSNDAFSFLVDDVSITDAEGKAVLTQNFENYSQNKTLGKSSPKEMLELAGFRVYRDGEPIGNIDDPGILEYLDEGLTFGTYSYQVSALYSSPEGESALSDAVEVTLEPPGSITFTVTDGTDPIEGAIISIEDSEIVLTTNPQGVATAHLVDGDYSFTVFAVYYQEFSGSFTIAGEAETKDITMTPVAGSLYTITFSVNSDGDPVVNAEIKIAGLAGNLTTDEDGEVNIDLPNGNYSYNVAAENFYPKSGSFTVAGAVKTVDIELTSLPMVNFFVYKGEDTPLEGAVIAIVGVEDALTTNADGLASIILADGNYNYSVSLTGYVSFNGSFTISGSDIDVDIKLNPVTFPVTFTVKNINQSPMQDASITITETSETLVTNSLGQALFSLPSGNYSYSVTKTNYFVAEGNFVVESQPKSVNVTIIGVSAPISTVSGVQVYPNPFNNTLRFSSDKPITSVVITNLIGQKVMTISPSNNDNNEIATSHLPSGIYVITFRMMDGEKINQRIVKNK